MNIHEHIILNYLYHHIMNVHEHYKFIIIHDIKRSSLLYFHE